MWEIFCEAERPSINDLIYTTVGGITIGETVWRTGECILDRLKKRHRAGYTSPLTASLTRYGMAGRYKMSILKINGIQYQY